MISKLSQFESSKKRHLKFLGVDLDGLSKEDIDILYGFWRENKFGKDVSLSDFVALMKWHGIGGGEFE